jgi:hypothetical protein
MNSGLGRIALVLGACLLSTATSSAGPSNPSHMPRLRTFLAGSNALSEAAMAKQTGTGLQPPAIITNDQGSGPRVQLWDELKIGPLMAPATSGMTTVVTPPSRRFAFRPLRSQRESIRNLQQHFRRRRVWTCADAHAEIEPRRLRDLITEAEIECPEGIGRSRDRLPIGIGGKYMRLLVAERQGSPIVQGKADTKRACRSFPGCRKTLVGGPP